MLYHSTRDNNLTADSAEAVLEGLAPDGGLYMPAALPAFDWQKCIKGSAMEMSRHSECSAPRYPQYSRFGEGCLYQ